jgi:hypothetical protein
MSAQPIWRWEDTPAYDLTVEIVNGYLVELFGNYNFYTEVRIFRDLKTQTLIRNNCRKPTTIPFDSGFLGNCLRLVVFVSLGEHARLAKALHRMRRRL